MKRINFVVALFAVLLSISCSTTSKGDGTLTFVETDGNELTVCHLNQVKDTLVMNLSDLVEDFKVVRFENEDNALFNYSVLPAITDNYIGIRQSRGRPYLLFDHNGKLKCEVGSVGNGPGEYNQVIYDEVINEKRDEIYLSSFASSSKILVYDTNGKFVREIVAKNRLNKPKIEVDDNGDITIIHMPFRNNTENFLAIQYSSDGSFKQELKPAPYLLVENFNSEMFAYHNVSEFSFWLTSCDTLFHYDKNANKIHPKFTVDFGDVSERPFHVYNEIPNYYLVSFGKGLVAVNKKTHTSNYVRLVNDFFGHTSASMFNFHKGWFFHMFEPGNLITRIERRLAEGNCSAEDRKQLEEILGSIDEDDNNILLMGKLKSN
ncbi:6-bladed beta-propeller [Bacteroides sp. UBA939]|uniref:6-bladed beta-propeller n=1 Tax=Bacteroides sp. UBA939 TaxID=1946092 RepID=UPI0025BE4BD7|nr:6-bladed beta-propeller [Bacteroides sp. UBA939]